MKRMCLLYEMNLNKYRGRTIFLVAIESLHARNYMKTRYCGNISVLEGLFALA